MARYRAGVLAGTVVLTGQSRPLRPLPRRRRLRPGARGDRGRHDRRDEGAGADRLRPARRPAADPDADRAAVRASGRRAGAAAGRAGDPASSASRSCSARPPARLRPPGRRYWPSCTAAQELRRDQRSMTASGVVAGAVAPSGSGPPTTCRHLRAVWSVLALLALLGGGGGARRATRPARCAAEATV